MAQRRHANPMTRQAIAGQAGAVSKALGQHYVSYHPLLVTITGNVKSALFLSHAIAWSRHLAKTRPERDGWFWMRAREWQDGAGLSVREQATARQILTRLGVLQEKRVGVPAKMWFRLDLNALGRLVANATGGTFESWSWDRTAMLKLLGQPIPCHRVLIQVAHGVVGGLILSHLFSSVRRDLVNGGDGEWMHIPVAVTRDVLGITAKQQRLARERLREGQLIEESFEQCVQPKLLTRLNLQVLADECTRNANGIHCLQDSRNLVCNFLQTRVAQNANLELPKAQNKRYPKRESGVVQNADQGMRKGPLPIKKEYIQIQLPPTVPKKPPVADEPAVSSGSDEVILPTQLLEGEDVAARQLLAVLPSTLAQLVADEWSGLIDLARRGVRPMHNRLGVLNTLVNRASGQSDKPFVPTLAFGCAAARKRRADIDAARALPKHECANSAAGIEAGRTMLKLQMAQIWGRPT